MHRANRHCSDNFEGPPGRKVDSSVMHIWVDADACPAAIKDIPFRAADQHTMDEVAAGDPVVTADIPLAAALIGKGAFALSPRGEFYSTENVRERLGLRDFMEGMRGAGANIGGSAALSQADRQAFANQLDRFLARRRRHAISVNRP